VEVPMLKTTLIFAAVIAAVGFVVASLALPVQQLLVVSSDALGTRVQ
jgi:hypothetical protein